MNLRYIFHIIFSVIFLVDIYAKDYVDYVNTKMGGVSRILVTAKETIQLPHSMIRAFAFKFDSAAVALESLPFFVHTHRFTPKLELTVFLKEKRKHYLFDREISTPYSYSTFLEDDMVGVIYAVSKRSAIYNFDFTDSSNLYDRKLNMFSNKLDSVFNDGKGYGISHNLRNSVKVYIYMEFDAPVKSAIQNGKDFTLSFDKSLKRLSARYGVSFISFEQARENLKNEIKDFDVNSLAKKGRDIWNKALSQIEVESSDENLKSIFYTSLWRTKERMVNYDEYGKFYNVYKNSVCDSFEGSYIYADDWSWDTYRASHPLWTLLNPDFEKKCLESILYYGKCHQKKWIPKFPTIDGDNCEMNGNHIVASFLDAHRKGIEGLDLKGIFNLALHTTRTKSILPDTICESGELSNFYLKNGYIPAIKEGETETHQEVNKRMLRQAVSVTTATAYDDWCLSQIADIIGEKEKSEKLLNQSYNYRNLIHPKTKFLHPKDKDGNFIKDVNYSTSGGNGFRYYYTENNAYLCRWDVEHNMPDLINQIGGYKAFETALDEMFSKSIPVSKLVFVMKGGQNHTGIVGNFSMANQPAMRIPYLYNSALTPWKTQKMVRSLLDNWFRNDIIGLPGDEDGGATSSFVIFSQLGFYPTNIGYPIYDFGTPFFEKAVIHLPNGKDLTLIAKNVSSKNKYIKNIFIDGKVYDKTWISHKDLISASTIEFEMSDIPNYLRGISPNDLPDYFRN